MFSIIVILSKNNCIGKDNNLLWHLPEDLKYFRKTTLNHKVLIGRKCFESLPKVLDKRHHIVLTKNKDFKAEYENVEVCNDLDLFIKNNKDSDEEVFVIGGGEIYKELLPFCKKLYITHVNKDFLGDTYFPNIDFDMYNKTFQSDVHTNEKEGVEFCFAKYEKK